MDLSYKTKIDYLQDKYNDVSVKINTLEEKVDEILAKLENVESLTSSQKTIKKASDDFTKLHADSFKHWYEVLGYDDFIKKIALPHKWAVEAYDGKDAQKLEEYDNWAEDVENSNDLYVKIADIVAWFNTEKIARMIARNNNALRNDKGSFYDVEENPDIIGTLNVNSYNYTDIKIGLDKNVKDCIEDLIKYGPANENETFKEFQVGRIHLLSVHTDEGDFLKLYWTNEESEVGTY